MTAPARKREVGRGERVLPGVWRLRLPLPWPGIPHGNAWALAAGDGIVLVDTGMHEPGSLAQLERALGQVNLRLEHVRLLVCTHAHADHMGQAAAIVERSGCELWMHPAHAHGTAAHADPASALARHAEIARTSGIPDQALRGIEAVSRVGGEGVAGPVTPDRDLVDGVEVRTDLGTWTVVETPGHAPSHVCLWQPERRVLITGDHLLGRVSLYYDYGWSDDPAGAFLTSLDRVEALQARLCLPGHGRTFADVPGHIAANRRAVLERLERLEPVVAGDGPITAYDAMQGLHGVPEHPALAAWWLTETLCYLKHLELDGRVRRLPRDGVGAERWVA